MTNQLVTSVNDDLKMQAIELSRVIPETMRAYNGLMRAASADGVLSVKIKELMAVAIGIARLCEGCVAYHVENARKFGATRAELAEAIAVAIEMGGGPAVVYGGKALAQFDAIASE
ncbi:carboxymuconolactone decarboxylase family protein [Beijerinckia sp. L45]|uniref:carboxymuconolactone decarboxylase family protein n=1 Tax=Beijerinckia sp. L45 TaxID=1641855 RepID=UPI001FEF3536|nr:carboxymuconolactone decarboxylase family protein [Beijerinckia sp. L45]